MQILSFYPMQTLHYQVNFTSPIPSEPFAPVEYRFFGNIDDLGGMLGCVSLVHPSITGSSVRRFRQLYHGSTFTFKVARGFSAEASVAGEVERI